MRRLCPAMSKRTSCSATTPSSCARSSLMKSTSKRTECIHCTPCAAEVAAVSPCSPRRLIHGALPGGTFAAASGLVSGFFSPPSLSLEAVLLGVREPSRAGVSRFRCTFLSACNISWALASVSARCCSRLMEAFASSWAASAIACSCFSCCSISASISMGSCGSGTSCCVAACLASSAVVSSSCVFQASSAWSNCWRVFHSVCELLLQQLSHVVQISRPGPIEGRTIGPGLR